MQNQDRYSKHCIIQWYEEGKQRSQTYFGTNNDTGSHSLTRINLIHYNQKFNQINPVDESSDLNNSYSFKISSSGTTIGRNTEDIFLYGHSTYREYRKYPNYRINNRNRGKVRGISIAGKYVSAAKVVEYIETIAPPDFKTKEKRIWLLSCYSGSKDLQRNNRAATFAGKIKKHLERKGWRNTKIISFDKPVTTVTLKECRVYAKDNPFTHTSMRTLDSNGFKKIYYLMIE